MSHGIFQSFWYGAPLSPYEWMCIKSFLDHGHPYHLYAYDAIEVPDGCVVMDAAEILPREQVFAYKQGGSFSAFSNWFRYKLLHDRGGWWVDTDIVCISDAWPTEPRQVGRESPQKINGAVIRAEPGDPMMAEAFRIAEAKGQDVTWGTIGPNLVTQLVTTGTYDFTIQETMTFYPIYWENFQQFLVPDFARIGELRQLGTVCLHLWNEMFRIHKVGKEVAPPPHSLLWECFEAHGLQPLFREQYLYHAEKRGLVGPLPIEQVTPAVVNEMLDMSRRVNAAAQAAVPPQ